MTPIPQGARRLAATALILLLAGIVVVVVTGGTAEIAGGALIAVAGVLAVSAVFYTVGRSEERERDRASR